MSMNNSLIDRYDWEADGYFVSLGAITPEKADELKRLWQTLSIGRIYMLESNWIFYPLMGQFGLCEYLSQLGDA